MNGDIKNTIEQDIWDEFSELSGYDFSEKISHREAKQYLSIEYEGILPKVYAGGHQFIRGDADKKIDEALLVGGEIDWNKILKLYPKSEIEFKYDYIKKIPTYPPPKFRTRKQWHEIEEILLQDWQKSKEGLYKVFPNEEKAREYLIAKRWGDDVICPFCGTGNPYQLKDGRYNCSDYKNCHAHFSVTVATIFQNTKLPLTKWYEAIFLLTNTKTHKLSTPQLARAVDVTQPTAWWLQNTIQSSVNDEFVKSISNELQRQ